MKEYLTNEQIARLREIDEFDIIEVQDGLRERQVVATGIIPQGGIGYARIGVDEVIGDFDLGPSTSFGRSFGGSFE